MSEAADDALPPPEPAPTIVVDTSEPPEMRALLEGEGIVVERQRLAPADYVVGPFGIERKAITDFHASLIDKRLFEQLTRLKETYASCALVLEGDPAFFAQRRAPSAAWGALCSVALDLEMPLLPTPDRASTAMLLATLARRVARGANASYGRGEVRYKPRLLGPHAAQKFAIQGLPGIGDVVSEKLLEHFGSVRRVYAANERELLRVPGTARGVQRTSRRSSTSRSWVGSGVCLHRERVPHLRPRYRRTPMWSPRIRVPACPGPPRKTLFGSPRGAGRHG